jgi:hypothetical protein
MHERRATATVIIAILVFSSVTTLENNEVVAQGNTVTKISTHGDNVIGHDYDPQIVVDAVGNSYVTWYGHDGNDYEIYWTTISSAGTLGTAQVLSTHANNVNSYDWYPQIGVDSAGNSYVVWEGYDGFDSEIYWTKVSSAGTLGTAQVISTHPDNVSRNDYKPQIAVDAAGNSYVTWYGHDGSGYSVYWTKVDSAGTLGTVEMVSNHIDNIYGDEYDPQIGIDTAGNSYVTWWGKRKRSYDVYWTKVDSAGAPGVAQKISTHPDNIGGRDFSPEIAVDGAGNSYVAWYCFGISGYDIYWTKVDSASTLGTVLKVSTHPDNVSGSDWYPHIAADSLGNSYIVWHGSDGSDNEIYWTTVDSAGTPGTVQMVSNHADNVSNEDFTSRIAVDDSQNSYIVWHGSSGSHDDIYWTYVDNTGTPGTAQKISTHADNGNGDDWFPQICVDSPGNSYVVWHGDDGNDWEIYFTMMETPAQGDSDGDGIPDEEDVCPDENPQGFDANLDGCTDRVCDLPQVVQSLGLNPGIENSLVQKATNACKKFNQGHVEPAGNILAAFINAVEAQRGKKISEEDADMLIQFARNAMAIPSKKSSLFVTPPGLGNQQIAPLAQFNLFNAEKLSSDIQNLLSDAQEKGFDISECEELILKAQEFLAMAQENYATGNYIAANVNALKAVEAFTDAMELLNSMLS